MTDDVPDGSANRAGHPLPRRRLSREIRMALVAVVVARTAVNGGIRVVFPFLPEIARGLDTTIATLGVLVALRSLVGLTAPFAAALGARIGRRNVMLCGLATVGLGSAVIAGSPTVAVAALGFLLVGLGKPFFDVPMQGWFGARVPFAQRGRVLGITELAWAGGLLATVPISGVLIGIFGWRVQFAVVVALVVAGLALVVIAMDDDRPKVRERPPLALTRPRVLMLGVVGLFTFAAECTFVVYGSWLEEDLGLEVSAIGLFTLVVVAAELVGEGGVAAFGDRLGLRRGMIAALVGSAVAYAALGLVGSSLMVGIVVVVAWFICFEVTIVSSVPLMTELGGEGRDRLLGLMVAVIAVTRAGAAILGSRLFLAGGIGATGLAAAAAALLAAVLMTRVRIEPADERVAG